MYVGVRLNVNRSYGDLNIVDYRLWFVGMRNEIFLQFIKGISGVSGISGDLCFTLLLTLLLSLLFFLVNLVSVSLLV